MFYLLYQYLIENTSLCLPGIGTLELVEIPAQLDIAEKKIVAPQRIVQLSAGGTNPDNKHSVMRFICRRLHINEEQAWNLFQDFSNSIQSNLAIDGIAHWENLGCFQKDESRNIQFVQTVPWSEYLSPVFAERVIRHDVEHNMTVGNRETTNIAMQQYYNETETLPKDYWWVWAIIIFISSVIAVFIKYYN